VSTNEDRPPITRADPQQTASTADGSAYLNDTHKRELTDGSAIAPDVIAERRYRTIGRPTPNDRDIRREELKPYGFPSFATREDRAFPALLIPLYGPNGRRVSAQLKPRTPMRNRQGKPSKYIAERGRPSVLDVHPRWSVNGGEVIPPIRDASRTLYVTEGVKKGDALTTQGCVTVALAGVWNWRGEGGVSGAWEEIELRGREVVICFDADAVAKPHVLIPMQRLGRWLRSRGVARVWYVLPTRGKGVDDHFAAGGTLAELEAARSLTPPTIAAERDPFTDAALADVIATDVLDGAYIRATGIGWLAWDGCRWAETETGTVTEAIRLYVLARYADALEEERKRVTTGEPTRSADIEGWRKMQSAARVAAVLSFADDVAGVVVDGAALDAHPDLLNTPAGVVDLATGEVSPHDPDLLMTKVTAADYRPGAEHGAWKTALDAVPEDAVPWLQARLGQGITGHMTDDERAVFLMGGGHNGKTCVMDTARRALGRYAELISPTLLVRSPKPDAATPDVMSIRGVRLAYIEETPEQGRLDTQALKAMVGTPAITGRLLYQNRVTFEATHSIFLNTNHAPTVAETGEGEWRRLIRLDFPWRYRRAGEALERDTDRRGDPTLKDQLKSREALEACLAWLVAGAGRWYAAGRTLERFADPASVTQATRRWRHESDVVLRFIDECLEIDRDSWVPGRELYLAFTEWLAEVGHQRMAENTFVGRLASHTALPAFVTAQRVASTRPGVSRRGTPWLARPVASLPAQSRAVLGLRFRA
jgi:P4 family phage/plasmid primase-like protien